MTQIRVLFLIALISVSSQAFAQDAVKKGDKGWTDLEKTLEDVNNQWICAYKYHKNHAQDCVDFKNEFWPDDFFEISRQGEVTDKNEMVKRQTARATAHPVSPGDAGPQPQRFTLRAVYGNVALATDHTVWKAPDASGKIVVTDDQGNYTLSRFEPGRAFIVMARPRPAQAAPVSDLPTSPAMRKNLPTQTFYPGTTSVEGAQAMAMELHCRLGHRSTAICYLS